MATTHLELKNFFTEGQEILKQKGTIERGAAVEDENFNFKGLVTLIVQSGMKEVALEFLRVVADNNNKITPGFLQFARECRKAKLPIYITSISDEGEFIDQPNYTDLAGERMIRRVLDTYKIDVEEIFAFHEQ